MTKKLIIFLSILLLSLTAENAMAGALSLPNGNNKDKKEDIAAKDPLGRDNPRSMITGFLQTLADKDYEKTVNYLDLGDKKDKETSGVETAKQLQTLLDQSGWIRPVVNLSNDDGGDQTDDLPPEIEKVGGIRTNKKLLPLLIEHVPAKDERAAYWRFSAETIMQIPQLSKEMRSSLLNKYLPKPLIDEQWWGIPVGHWMALIGLAIVSYFIMWAFTDLFKFIFHAIKFKLFKEKTESEILQVFIKPIQLYLSVWISVSIIRYIGVSLLARQVFGQVANILGWVFLAWIIWRLIDVFALILRSRLINHRQYSLLSAVVFFRRGTKVALSVIVFITVLDSFGFQVTTWLAALGIGGIALALGAQKTVENFVGSLTLIADRPIAIGDFCKFGSAKGTVEDIGMRSTRIRTVDRTLVSIPNGDFASMQIENYSKRDSFYYNPTIGLVYDTTPHQIRDILSEIRTMLGKEEKVKKDDLRVSFFEFGAAALNIEISCYILVPTYAEAMVIKEDLNLKIMDIVKKCGSNFAFIPPAPPAK